MTSTAQKMHQVCGQKKYRYCGQEGAKNLKILWKSCMKSPQDFLGCRTFFVVRRPSPPVMILGSPGTLLVKKGCGDSDGDGESSLAVKSLYGRLMIQSWNVMQ